MTWPTWTNTPREILGKVKARSRGRLATAGHWRRSREASATLRAGPLRQFTAPFTGSA
jgi:hypothetical protein